MNVHPPFLPVPTGTEAAAFDARAREGGVAGPVLMENAGRAAADLAMEMRGHAPPDRPVLVVAGAGKNGGDAVVTARTLHARGVPVLLRVDPRRPDPDPLLHGHAVPRRPLPDDGSEALLPTEGAAPSPSLIVDGLLGTGAGDAPREPVAGWIRAVNALAIAGRVPVLALDLPSGVIADSGKVPGEAIRASVTIGFGAPKLGTLLHPGRALAGRLVVAEIGFPPWPSEAASGALVTGAWARSIYPFRGLRTHKNATGRLLLVAGGQEMGGAAMLAARAALRAGVGMLRVLCHPEHREAFHAAVPEAILPDPHDHQAVRAALAASDALAAGPGMGLHPGSLPGRWLEELLASLEGGSQEGGAEPGERSLLLDADALTRLARDTLALPRLDPGRILLTPHPGEWARMMAGGAERRGHADMPADARALARSFGATCLLKGTPSFVAGPGLEPVRISASGSSSLARGGMGDVLSGVAGALLARGLEAGDAGALALHLTGRAADFAGGGDALLPSDVVEALGDAIEELRIEAPPTAGAPDLPFRGGAILVELAAPR